MVLLTGETSIIRTMLTLIAASKLPHKLTIRNLDHLQIEYRKFLNIHYQLGCNENTGHPLVVTSPERIAMLKSKFSQLEALDDLQ
jgi:hypothetical protein